MIMQHETPEDFVIIVATAYRTWFTEKHSLQTALPSAGEGTGLGERKRHDAKVKPAKCWYVSIGMVPSDDVDNLLGRSDQGK